MGTHAKRLTGDWLHSSEEDPGPCCDFCTRDSKKLPAVGYCVTCKELLCRTCYRIHTIPKPSRDHMLIETTDIPHDQPSEADSLVAPSSETHGPSAGSSLSHRDHLNTKVDSKSETPPKEHGPKPSCRKSPSDKDRQLEATASKQRSTVAPRPSLHTQAPRISLSPETPTKEHTPHKVSPVCNVPCPEHKGKTIEYFCPLDGIVACNTCVTLNHRRCEVQYIPDLEIARTFHKSAEYHKTLSDLETLRKKTNATCNDVKENRKAAKAGLKVAIEDMKLLIGDVVKVIEEQEAALAEEGETLNTADDALAQGLENDLNRLSESTEETTQRIRDNENEDLNLFAATVLSRKKVKDLNNELKDIADKKKKIEYKFTRNKDLQNFLDSKGTLGKLERSCGTSKPMSKLPKPPTIEAKTGLDLNNVKIVRLDDVDVATPADKDATEITGIASLRKNTLLVADYWNNALKSVTFPRNMVTDKLIFNGNPYDIALLPDHQAAVTCPPQNVLQFVSTKDKLSWLKNIKVGGWCYGIAGLESNLVVSFQNPGRVAIITVDGHTLKTIAISQDAEPLFRNPNHVTVMTDNSNFMRGADGHYTKCIFVSDWMRNTVNMFSDEHETISTITNPTWASVFGLSSLGPNLLVCNKDGQSVDVICDQGKTIFTLLNTSNGLVQPRSLCWCEERGILYVSGAVRGTSIKAFKVSKRR